MAGRKREPGNVGEILAMGLCVLALTAVMLSYLTAPDQAELKDRLEVLGLTQIDYDGSSLEPVGYGNDVVLQIRGRLGEDYEIYEKRVSTAKN